MEEEKRTKIWRVTATASLIIVVIVAAFFMIRIMADNPTRGTWSNVDSDLTLSIPSFGSVTASWPESDTLSNVTVKMNRELHRGHQLISFEADQKAVAKADNAYAAAYLVKEGLVLEKLGKKAEALDCYKTVKDKYPQSIEAYDIDRYISAVEE